MYTLKKYIIAFILIISLCCIFSVNVFAESTHSKNISFDLTTDKDIYSKGDDITVKVIVTNNSNNTLKNLSINNSIPDGLKLKDSKQKLSIANQTVKPEDTIEMQFVVNQIAASASTNSPGTKDSFNISIYIFLLILSITGISFIVYKKKISNKLISLLLAIMLIFVNCDINTYAANDGNSSISANSNDETLVKVSKTIQIDNQSYQFTSVVKYTEDIQLPEDNVTDNEADSDTDSNGDDTIIDDTQNDNSENNNSDTLDSDNDGLYDYIEDYYNTDKYSADTDSDNLTDYEELKYTKTDPLIKDTNNTGKTDSLKDDDNDGLSNLTELDNKTTPLSPDTDSDGLDDYYELYTSKTNPLKDDTDGDGIEDKWELDNNYNPLVANSAFNIEKSIQADNSTIKATVNINLKGSQIGSLSINPVEDNVLNDEIPGYLGCAYDFNVIGEFDEATLSFEFDSELLNDKTFKPAIYYYNEEKCLLEELETTVSGNVASAKTTHFSKYILLNKTKFDVVWENEISIQKPEDDAEYLNIAFVVDTSGSMEGEKMDTTKAVLKEFVDSLDANDRVALVEFNEVATVYVPLTTDREELEYFISLLDGRGGTVAFEGIGTANELFAEDTSDNAKNIMILLSDGEDQFVIDDYNEYYQEYYAHHVQTANDNDVTIYTIGFEESNSAILKPVAENTNGKYYHVETVNKLNEPFENIKNEVTDQTEDSNNDGISDYYTKLMCDRELFLGTGRNVFGDLTYEKVQSNADWDKDGLLNGDEIKILQDDKTGVIYVKMISDPLSKDSDDDGYEDNEDLAPLKKFKKPVILIHGRGDNTANTYGASTNIQVGDNSHYNAANSLNGDSYTDIDSHMITSIKDGKLAKKLIDDYGYVANENLFAFNYPNQDFNQFNASKLSRYIYNIMSETNHYDVKVKASDIFATIDDLNNLNPQLVLIGHSNGGLVSRYYIENLNGSKFVDRLITIDTPHYGSGIAYASTIIDIADVISECYPLDVELQPNSTLFGGKKDTYTSILNPERAKYINNNQSPSLKGNSSSTKYYAVAGYDVSVIDGEMKNITSELRNKVFGLEITRDLKSRSKFDAGINSVLNNYSINYCGKESELNLGDSAGDNVVDTMSQLGVNFNSDGTLNSYVAFERTALVIDTVEGHNMINHFHSKTLEENVTLSYVTDYIK